MRAAELVRRADQHVGADLAHVDRLVRRVVDGVDPGERAGVVRELAHPAGVHDRADRVGRPGERDHLGARPELALEVVEVERRVVVQLDVPDDQAGVVRELQPRRDAAVMIERGDEDLIARAEAAASGPRQHEVQRGHVRPEDHLMGLAAEEPRRLALGLVEDLARHAGSSRSPRRGWRSPRAAPARSPGRPRRAPVNRLGRRGTRSPAGTRSDPGRRRRRCSCGVFRSSAASSPRPGTGGRPDCDRITTARSNLKTLPLPWHAARWFDHPRLVRPVGERTPAGGRCQRAGGACKGCRGAYRGQPGLNHLTPRQ